MVGLGWTIASLGTSFDLCFILILDLQSCSGFRYDLDSMSRQLAALMTMPCDMPRSGTRTEPHTHIQPQSAGQGERGQSLQLQEATRKQRPLFAWQGCKAPRSSNANNKIQQNHPSDYINPNPKQHTLNHIKPQTLSPESLNPKPSDRSFQAEVQLQKSRGSQSKISQRTGTLHPTFN